jgi:hypothetical protein
MLGIDEAVLEDDRDLAHHLIEPAADQAQPRLRVDLLVMERRPALLQRLAERRDRGFTLEGARQTFRSLLDAFARLVRPLILPALGLAKNRYLFKTEHHLVPY